MTLKQILQLLLMLLMALIIVGYFSNENDAGSFAAVCIIYILFLIFILEMRDKNTKPLLYMLVIHSIFWIVIRICYLNFDPTLVQYGDLIGGSIPLSDLIFTIEMLLLSTAFLVAGIQVGGKISISNITNKVTGEGGLYAFNIRDSFLFRYLLIILVLTIIHTSTAEMFKTNYWIQIFGILTFYGPILMLFICHSVYYWGQSSNKKKIKLVVIGVLFVIMRTLGGSKGGLFYLITIFLYFVGHELHVLMRSHFSEKISFSFYLEHLPVVFEYATNVTSFKDILNPISERLSMYDYSNIMFNYEPVNDYLGFTYGLKMVWNTIIPHYLLPSLYFEEAIVFPANLFKLAYGFGSYEQVIQHYHSDMLPLFGYLFMNMWFISLPVIFLIGFLFSYFYKRLSVSQIKNLYFYKTLYLFYFANILFGMGFANTYIDLQDLILIPLVMFFSLQKIFSSKKQFDYGVSFHQGKEKFN